MAKASKASAKKDDDRDPDDTDLHVESNTTSGGKAPEPTDGPASIENDGPQGAAHYPPSPSDQAGEKTDNIAPSKLLPPDVPPSEQPDEKKALEAQLVAMATALRNLGIDPEPICDEAVARVAGEAKATATGPTRRAVVTPAGGEPVEVDIPRDAKDAHAAAVAAWKEKCGLWSVPNQPHVDLR